MSAVAPEHWGRVDAEGTVWVRTGSGERAVGSFPGAPPSDALAFFARRYDELAGQVALLEQRMRSTDLSPKDAQTAVDRLRTAVVEAHAVGDLDALTARVDALVEQVAQRRAAADEARALARAQARETKSRIVAEAEELAGSTSWKAAGDRMRELLEEWKAAPRPDRRTDDELWKAFSAARSAFDKRRRQHFASLEVQRGEARARKEALVTEAERLADSTDWQPTAVRFRELMADWRAAGRADRSADDELWKRFKAAQDRFFAARGAVFAERDAGLRGNLERKEALVAEAERLLPVTDLRSARATLRSIADRWEKVGHVPRDARERVEGRLRRVEEAVRAAERSEWRRTNPEARRRAEDTVAQLHSSIEALTRQAERAHAAGEERRAAEAEAAVAARRSWLVEAEKTLAEFSPPPG